MDEENKVTEENLVMINEITVTYCEYKMLKKCQHPELDTEKLRAEILGVIYYVTGVQAG